MSGDKKPRKYNDKPNQTSFRPGETGNALGRPPKLNAEDIIKYFKQTWGNRMSNLDRDLEQMTPWQRFSALEQIRKNFFPDTNLFGASSAGPIQINVQFGPDQTKGVQGDTIDITPEPKHIDITPSTPDHD